MNDNKKNILLFDGVCNLCNSLVNFIIERDTKGKFTFATLQSQSGQALLKKFNLAVNDFNSFVYIKENRVYLKSSGVLHVLKDLGGIWKAFFIFIIIPKPFRDIFYNIIAKIRYKIFGKRKKCMIPTPEIKRRFLV